MNEETKNNEPQTKEPTNEQTKLPDFADLKWIDPSGEKDELLDPPFESVKEAKQGEYVQMRYRELADKDVTPPVFYVGGRKPTKKGGTEEVMLFSIYLKQWYTFDSSESMCAIRPIVSEKERAELLPFIINEPTFPE